VRILFIRHARAVEADAFAGCDLARPLTPEGRKRFKRVANRLAKRYPVPDRLISSNAVRARQTAEALAAAYGCPKIEVREELNPGASVAAIQRVVEGLGDVRWVALVGHEPDFSQAVSAWVAGGRLDLKLKKGGVVEIETLSRGRARLRAVWDPARI